MRDWYRGWGKVGKEGLYFREPREESMSVSINNWLFAGSLENEEGEPDDVYGHFNFKSMIL